MSDAARAPVGDDSVLPFSVASLDVRGRIVRLGPTIDNLLSGHGYPPPVMRLAASAACLTTLLGTALKFDGRFILQTQTDGPVSMLVVEFTTPDAIRAYARFDAEAVAALADSDEGALLGSGHLAMTVDQGENMGRYQGVVALHGGGLEDAAHRYFEQSEQIPTRVRLATAELLRRGNGGAEASWRSGGMLVQFLPDDMSRMAMPELHPGDAPEGHAPVDIVQDDAWVEAEARAASLEDIELTDPDLTSERLLLRVFNEHEVHVFDGQPIAARCGCSQKKIDAMMAGFSEQDRRDMAVDGTISVTCEFCGKEYRFDPG